MGRGNIIALLHALSGALALFVGLSTRGGFARSAPILKPLGLAIFAGGMLLFGHAAISLREAFRGGVEPISERLITGGPYRLVRHPLYLGMIISIIGLSLGMRSVWGLALAIVAFLPLTILRAKLEEARLHERFGLEWEEYAERTSFLIPLVL